MVLPGRQPLARPTGWCTSVPRLCRQWTLRHQASLPLLADPCHAPSNPTNPQVTSGTIAELQPAVVDCLAQLGSVPLRCRGGEQEMLYSMPKYASLALTQPPAAAAPAQVPPPPPTAVAEDDDGFVSESVATESDGRVDSAGVEALTAAFQEMRPVSARVGPAEVSRS